MTVAAGLLYLAALNALLLAVFGLVFLGRLRAATRVGYGYRNNVEQLVSSATTGTVAISIGLVLLALNLTLFATFDLRGSGIARLASWGVAGVGVLCCGGTGLADRYGNDPATPLAYPGWYITLHGWLIAAEVVALLLAALLLVLPPVHRFVAPRMVPAGDRGV